MEPILYPLAASKMLRHCEIFFSNMLEKDNEELVELSFNEFITSADRTLQYLHKELNKIGGQAPTWFRDKRDTLPRKALFYQLRHIVAHHFFIPLTPIISISDCVPPKQSQITEYRLDFEMIPKDKQFDKKRNAFIEELGPSVDAILLCKVYLQDLNALIREAELKYGNRTHFVRGKLKSGFRVNTDHTLSYHERRY